MLGVILTLKVQEGKTAEFEAAFGELAAQVRKHETGVVFYQFTRSRTEANTYKVLEGFKDQAAFEEHGRYEHTKTLFPKVAPLLVGGPQVEFLDPVG
jgi:quinol monooxygenase YgiN